MWSINRPGVATIICGLLAKFIVCDIISTPPTITEHLTPIDFPSASNWVAICDANSLVGVNIRAKYLCGFSNNSCKIGNAKAAVFPDPVSANPTMSRP